MQEVERKILNYFFGKKKLQIKEEKKESNHVGDQT